MPKIIRANGKERDDAIVSPHWYLQDASFLVVLQTAESWQQRIMDAMAAPVWCMYLGRKNCVPSRPVWDGIHSEYASIEDAICRYPLADRADAEISYELEQAGIGRSSLTRPDRPLAGRKFDCRLVWRGNIRRNESCT